MWRMGDVKTFSVGLIREKSYVRKKQIGLSCGCSRRTTKRKRVRKEIWNHLPSRSFEESSLYESPRWLLGWSARLNFVLSKFTLLFPCLLQHRLANLCIILNTVDRWINSFLFNKVLNHEQGRLEVVAQSKGKLTDPSRESRKWQFPENKNPVRRNLEQNLALKKRKDMKQ